MNLKLALFSSLLLPNFVFAADSATLEYWLTGVEELDCPFTYEIEPKLEWNRVGDPPLTISALNEAFRNFADRRYPDKSVSIGSYHLIYNNFILGGDVGWIYQITYSIKEPGSRSIDGFDGSTGRALVTMHGTVIEVECNAQ